MNKVLMGAAALAMMVPGAAMAATDGDPGATSTGSFSATLNVQPPTGVTVQVVGLDDYDFGTVTTTNTAGTNVSGLGQRFCLLRSDAGDVRVNIGGDQSSRWPELLVARVDRQQSRRHCGQRRSCSDRLQSHWGRHRHEQQFPCKCPTERPWMHHWNVELFYCARFDN
ncbi:MAG: hypothetical protein IPN84_08475 [Sphingomonadales bacterium]|nr:hypothetical protein [Sphingomonadales bacterium]